MVQVKIERYVGTLKFEVQLLVELYAFFYYTLHSGFRERATLLAPVICMKTEVI